MPTSEKTLLMRYTNMHMVLAILLCGAAQDIVCTRGKKNVPVEKLIPKKRRELALCTICAVLFDEKLHNVLWEEAKKELGFFERIVVGSRVGKFTSTDAQRVYRHWAKDKFSHQELEYVAIFLQSPLVRKFLKKLPVYVRRTIHLSKQTQIWDLSPLLNEAMLLLKKDFTHAEIAQLMQWYVIVEEYYTKNRTKLDAYTQEFAQHVEKKL